MDRKETVHPGPALLSTSWVQLTWGVNACMAGDQAGDGPSKEAASPAVYRLLISISHLKRTELPRGMVTDLLPPPPYLHWLYFPSKHTSTSSKHSLQNEATYKLPAALILALTSDKAAPKACDTSFLVCSTGVLFPGWAHWPTLTQILSKADNSSCSRPRPAARQTLQCPQRVYSLPAPVLMETMLHSYRWQTTCYWREQSFLIGWRWLHPFFFFFFSYCHWK